MSVEELQPIQALNVSSLSPGDQLAIWHVWQRVKQRDLADRINVDQAYLSRVISGRPCSARVARLIFKETGVLFNGAVDTEEPTE